MFISSLFESARKRLIRGFSSSRKATTRRRAQCLPPVEGLEYRALLSVNAVFDVDTNQLHVTASKNGHVQIGTNNNGQVTVNGKIVRVQSENGSVGRRAVGLPVDASDVAVIDVICGSGKNKINLSGVKESSFRSLTNVTIEGGEGNDRIVGSEFSDSIDGGAGDDVIDGGAGNDSCHGGCGNDDLFGGSGIDDLLGEDGDDSLQNDDGEDYEDGGDGLDSDDACDDDSDDGADDDASDEQVDDVDLCDDLSDDLCDDIDEGQIHDADDDCVSTTSALRRHR